MSPRRWVPLAWGLGGSTGLLVAVFLGVYDPGWGVVLSFPAATLVIAVGVLREPDDETLPIVLRALLAATLGFLVCTSALTLDSVAAVAAAGGEPSIGIDGLLVRYAVLGSLAPLAIAALVVRRRRRAGS